MSSIQFPSLAPDSLEPIADGLITTLGSLVPPSHAARIRSALAGLPMSTTPSIGLEVTLPPGKSSCDLSVLLPPGITPAFAVDEAPSLTELTREIALRSSGTVWWECDTSEKRPPLGAFIRFVDGVDAFDTVRRAAPQHSGLAEAVDHLQRLCSPFMAGDSAIVGMFPTRAPAAAAVLFHPTDLGRAVSALSQDAVGCVDLETPLIHHLLATCDLFAVSVGCDVLGRVAVSAEASFKRRERAMLDRRWDAVFARPDAWGAAATSLPSLAAVQGAHSFTGFLPWGILSGIDHIKVGPGGRVKAYVGALPFLRGVGPAGAAITPAASTPSP
jgi:hypothetical protein